jgi:hypothetical protein
MTARTGPPMFLTKFFARQTVALIAVFALCASQSPAQNNGYLKIVTLEGEGAFNDVKHGVAHPPSVRILDESNNLVEGAEVTFTLPAVGPSGLFTGNGRTGTATTNDKGEAHCPAYKPNLEEGRFNIRVAASYRGKTGMLVISQSNTSAGGTSIGQGKKSNKGLLILLLVAGGAAAGIGVALGGKSSSSTPTAPPTTLSTAGITVGAPR